MKGKYSQNDEDLLIERYFRTFTGTILEIGSNDGKTLSNSLAAIERGWKAVLIEPSETAFNKLSALHFGNEKVKCFQVAIGSEEGQAVFYESGEHLGTGDTSLISTLIPGELDRWKGTRFDNFTPTKVNVVTWASIYEGLEEKIFDVVSIDVEGMEIPILEQMNLVEMGCKMLIVEWNGKHKEIFNSIAFNQGFKLLASNGENLIYAK